MSHSHSHAATESEPEEHAGLLLPVISLTMLLAGSVMSFLSTPIFSTSRWVEFAWYLIAFLPVGIPVVKEAVEAVTQHDYFNEFTLMLLACIGAFCIGEYPEAVGVMLFYTIGEMLQERAVDSATRNIARLLDVRGERAHVVRGDRIAEVKPQEVAPGDVIEVRPGERVPLDGTLLDHDATFDTSALTGESLPRDIGAGGEVLAGMISSQLTIRLRVTREYGQSALARILELVNNASSRKADAELFIHKFARVYTPIVILLAALLALGPAVYAWCSPSFQYDAAEWVYRALVFLVISCPCALVISVPLGYFAGIGAASRLGVLFKGGNYLEAITRVNIIAFDKTGTLTTGRFSVESVQTDTLPTEVFLSLIAAAESGSSHPLAKAVVEYADQQNLPHYAATAMSEQAGYGTRATVDGHEVWAGNMKMLREANIAYPPELATQSGTLIVGVVDGTYAGHIVLADTVKEDSVAALRALRALGIKDLVMLSGDHKEIVNRYAAKLGISEAHGELLPQDKANYVAQVAQTAGRNIAFVGDGMNDAPVLALSNVGIAMGGLGSDAAIESADVVIQTDQPSRIATAIRIGRATHTIVLQNIIFAIAVKVLILLLGATGYASLWAAVFADVGVALIAVLNSMRIMWKRYQ